jgi:hypothetical protein
MALVNMEKVDKGKLKEMVKLLNPVLDENKMDKVKVVGISPQAMADGFTVQVEALADAEKTEELKAKAPAVIEFYNNLEFIEGGESEWGKKKEATPAAAPAAPETTDEAAPPAAAPPVKKERAKKEPADPNAPKKPRGNPPKSGIMSRPANWEELQKRLATPLTPTAYMDALTLTGGTVEELVTKFQEWRKANAPDYNVHFKTVTSLKAHIEYRKTKGWEFEEKDGKVKLIGYKA